VGQWDSEASGSKTQEHLVREAAEQHDSEEVEHVRQYISQAVEK
jgi:hypothetical protein